VTAPECTLAPEDDAPAARVATAEVRPLRVVSEFEPAGDQPEAIEELVAALAGGEARVTLLGATGTGKTFTAAKVLERLQRPALVLAPNKTLAAQLANELREFLPDNAVEYFVSYYDYYQPEAYVATSDTFIEKDATINDEIDRLRHRATMALLTRRDVVIVASVSCIYGLGSPQEYLDHVLLLQAGQVAGLEATMRRLVALHYDRNDVSLTRGTFRVRGDTLEVFPADDDKVVRVEFFGDEVERIVRTDPVSGQTSAPLERVALFPTSHYVSSAATLQRACAGIEAELAERLEEFERDGKLLEAQRLRMRTNFDLEMLRETGFCTGVENYSAHFDGRSPGEAPYTLLDYFPDDFITIIDESHVTIPQLGAMYAGDRSRKATLIEHGFRLPSAADNRPLRFAEFEQRVGQQLYLSATPGPYERKLSDSVVEQLIRPTGVTDPKVEVRPTLGQIDDLLEEIRLREQRGERALVTTLTKRMSEDLTGFLQENGVRVRYLHSDIDTVERVEILRALRLGEFDVLVGINLLREGLDLPEVSLVAILDADKEGFLRSDTALVQTIGRAARNAEGTVIMYADRTTDSMRRAIDETTRRRAKQLDHNRQHGIVARTVSRPVSDLISAVRVEEGDTAAPAGPHVSSTGGGGDEKQVLSRQDLATLAVQLEVAMQEAATGLRFEQAARLRDEAKELRRLLDALDETRS
jgi:excinuclease ABC subunit B